MSRVGWVLVVLASVVMGALWYFLIFSPTSDDIEAVRAETERVEAQAADARAHAAELREIRLNAPESEAQLAFGRSLIPEDAALPSLFRQMQQAADDSGVRLVSIVPTAPTTQTVEGVGDVAAIGVSMTLQASYFQIVDFARRVEDPILTPRALRWTNASISPTEFPELTVSISGNVFSRGLTDAPLQEEPPVDETPVDGDEVDELDELEGGGE